MRHAACPPPRLKQLTVAVAALAVAASTAVSPARALNIEVTRYTLGNGMQVVVIPDRRAPVVTQMVWYKVGAADEPQGKAGIAHFLEHLMFKGTPRSRPASSRASCGGMAARTTPSPARTSPPITSESPRTGSTL